MLKDSNRISPTAALIGSVLLFVGTWLHPMSADPNVPSAAFVEYAADHHWVASHLMQLLGVTLMMAALVLLSRRMAEGPATTWATLGAAGAVASIAFAGALQAVDGVALKAMVDSWARSAEPRKAPLFEAAFGVRQIEIGLAATMGVTSGLTVSVYGIALLIDRRFPRWIGIGALVGGPPTAVAGIVTAYTGFSPLSMSINLQAGLWLIFWMTALGVYGWRRSRFL
jgi:hypothetical protein